MSIIRSYLFKAIFYLWTAIFCILYIPLMWISQDKLIACKRFWSYGVLIILRFIMNTRLEIKGQHNIPIGGAVLATKHQSSFDTFVMHTIVKKPAFIMKKELLKIPLYGSFCLKTGMIPVDRDGGLKALKDLMQKSLDAINDDRQVIIFPEGSRTIPGNKVDYQSGVYGVYKYTKLPVIPVALNSGLYWPKKGHLLSGKVITFDFLDAIEPGKSKDDFMQIPQDRIESKSDQLILYPTLN